MNETEGKTWRDNHGNACAKHLEKAEGLVLLGIALIGAGVMQLIESDTASVLGASLEALDAGRALEAIWIVVSALALAHAASAAICASQLEKARVPPPVRLSYVAGTLLSRNWVWTLCTAMALLACWSSLCGPMRHSYFSYGMTLSMFALLLARAATLRLSATFPVESTRIKLGWPGPSSEVPDFGSGGTSPLANDAARAADMAEAGKKSSSPNSLGRDEHVADRAPDGHDTLRKVAE